MSWVTGSTALLATHIAILPVYIFRRWYFSAIPTTRCIGCRDIPVWRREQPSCRPFAERRPIRILSDGRKMEDVSIQEWSTLPEVNQAPLGVGPYILEEWIYGKSITLEANPFYFDSPATTPKIIVRFLEHPQAFAALLNGELDILDWETIGTQDIEDFQLAQAQDEGKVRLIIQPALFWEQISFKLEN